MRPIGDGSLGKLLRDARLRQGWTQEDLARRLGVKDSYISQWETGGRKWPQEYVRPLAKLLGLRQVDMAVAAGLIDPPDGPTTVSPPDPLIADLIDALDGATPAQLRTLAAMVRAMRNPIDGN